MSRPKVTIILLNYHRWWDTVECIHSLKKCSYANAEILIVENGSMNDSELQLTRAFPDIPILQSGRNLGYAGGINFGITHSRSRASEYILALNPDTVVDPSFLDHLVDAMISNPSSGAACGTILQSPETTKAWYAGGKFVWWRASGFSHLSISNPRPRNIQVVSFATGCALLLRRSALDRAGLFDERFFLYLEDTELCLRLQRVNYKILYVPASTIFHKVSGGRSTPLPVYYTVRNRLLLASVILKRGERLVACAYVLVVFILKIILWSFRNTTLSRAALYGIEDFFRSNFDEGRGKLFTDSQSPGRSHG